MRMNFEEVRRAPLPDKQPSAAVAEWLVKLDESGIPRPQALMRRFPHVLEKLAAAWGSALAMQELMTKDLLIDNRGSRQGFPFAVLSEIQDLDMAHQARHPGGLPQTDIWTKMHLR